MEGELSGLIKSLREEGVERGRMEADRIAQEARADASRIVNDARTEAERIVEEARTRAADTMKHLEQQMSLALRDLLLKARAELTELVALKPLRRAAEDAFADPEFIKKLISTMLSTYARSQAAHESRLIHITIPEEMKDAFVKEWMSMMRGELKVQATLHAEKGLKGFRLFTEGSGGELVVDAASMIEVLRPFVSERFREILDEQTAKS